MEQKPPRKKNSLFLIIIVAVLGTVSYFLFVKDGRIKRPGFDSEMLEQSQKKADATLNQYLELYAGTYEIKLRGYSGSDTEMYQLFATGEANYIWIFGDRKTEEQGSWTASHQKIIVTLKGNSNDNIQTFVREGSNFILTTDNNRYLVKR